MEALGFFQNVATMWHVVMRVRLRLNSASSGNIVSSKSQRVFQPVLDEAQTICCSFSLVDKGFLKMKVAILGAGFSDFFFFKIFFDVDHF